MTSEQIPLVIGVTGHRDLLPEQEPLLEARIEALFVQLQQDFPGLPLQVMTAIADGADRLAARVAQRLGIPITLLMPMPEALYREQFETEPGPLFDEMLSQSEVVYLPELDPADLERQAPGVSAMDARYAYLGVYLAAHSQLLLAIWDGTESGAPGGTSSVVRFHQHSTMDFLSGEPERSPIDFSEDESDLVYHIACSRRSGSAPADDLAPGECGWLSRDDLEPRSAQMPERYRRVFGRQQRFNRDLAKLSPVASTEALVTLEADAGGKGLPELEEVRQTFHRVDRLAISFQQRAMWSIRLTYLFIGLAGISFIAYADLTVSGMTIYLYLAFLVIAMALHEVERRNDWYRRYLDYRGLAEGIRVQFYWALAGVRPGSMTRFSHDILMRHQDLEAGWIRNVMRYVGRRVDAAGATGLMTPAAGLSQAIDSWVGDDATGQIAFYQRSAGDRLGRSRLTGRLTTLSFVVGAALALLLALFQARVGEGFRDIGIALMGLVPFLAAVRQSYAHRVLERELIVQYGYMTRIFSNSRRLLDRSSDPEEQREILRALGEAALEELGSWIMRQRERPVSGSQLFQMG